MPSESAIPIAGGMLQLINAIAAKAQGFFVAEFFFSFAACARLEFRLYFGHERKEPMKPSESIKPISYLKTHASEVIRDVVNNQKTLVITRNGEAKVVVQDVRVYEQIQESLALLKMLAQSTASLKAGKVKPIGKAFDDLRKRIDRHRR